LKRSCFFTYQNGDLTSVEDMGGFTTAIEYDANHWVSKITYPNGSFYRLTYENSNLYPADGGGAYYVPPFRMRVIDSLNQTNEMHDTLAVRGNQADHYVVAMQVNPCD
jgi:YD repeat-containing protein